MRHAAASSTELLSSKTPDWTFSVLKPCEQDLAYLISDVGYGRIDGLLIFAGEPQYEPAPTVTQTIKLDVQAGWCPPRHSDFKLKAPFVSLFTNTRSFAESTLVQITIHGGLPTQMERRMTYAAGASNRSDGFGLTFRHAN